MTTPNTPPPIQSPASSRATTRPGSPASVAMHHLRRRKIAMFCFGILVLYFLIAGLTYIRMPGTKMITRADGTTIEVEREFIGEWFESLATRRLVNEAGDPIDYARPSLNGASHFNSVTREWTIPAAYWDATASREQRPAHGFHFIAGTDIQGRSVFWRTLYGARMSMTIALGAAILAVLIGTSLGAIAGYYGGPADVFITWLFTTVASIPRILLILALAYTLRGKDFEIFGTSFELTGTPMLILAMGLTSWVSLCRLIRGEVMKQRSMDYESAARAIGLTRGRILGRHLLPNVTYLVIIQFSLLFPLFIHLEVILSYLGLGATEGVSWGQMIEASLLEMMKSPMVWWQLAAATVAVFGVSLALNLFGDALRDALDPRLQGVS